MVEKIDEFADISEMIRRFIASNGHRVAFIGSFVAFDKKGDVKDDTDMIYAYGEKELLKLMLNGLKDACEAEVDEDGFVNI